MSKSGRIDIDFIKEFTNEKDIDLFLGPIDSDQERVWFEDGDSILLAHFMVRAGVFPSVSQARKNGWNKPIPKGFSQFIVGKNKALITILNIEE